MTERSDERIALFIDGANLYSAARELGFVIDFRRLLEYFGAEGRLVRAYYYTALFDEVEYSPLRSSPPMVADELRRQAEGRVPTPARPHAGDTEYQ